MVGLLPGDVWLHVFWGYSDAVCGFGEVWVKGIVRKGRE